MRVVVPGERSCWRVQHGRTLGRVRIKVVPGALSGRFEWVCRRAGRARGRMRGRMHVPFGGAAQGDRPR